MTDDAPACQAFRAGETFRGKQGLTYAAGISAQTAGATGICMHVAEFPPGARAKAHLHEAHETAIYMLEGEVTMLHGPRLEQTMTVRAGDMVYIPAGVPHLPMNRTDRPARAVLSRTDPEEQESVRLLPELEAAAPA